MDEMLARFFGVVAIVMGACILLGVGVYLLVGPDIPYEERIEKRYNITVTEINNSKGGGYVVFRNTDGQLCTANMAENDVLITTGCE